MFIAVIAALFVAFLWGISPIIHKNLLVNLNHLTIIVIGGFIYTLVLIVIATKNWHIIKPNLTKDLTLKHFGLIAFTTLVAGFLANYIYLRILKNNNSYFISALIYTSPVFTLLTVALLKSEKITIYAVIGILLITFGIISIVYNEHINSKEEYIAITKEKI